MISSRGFFHRVIEYTFYLLFLLVPLTFTADTSELFEFNKMWLTFGLTIIIGSAWCAKMVVEKRFLIQHTPLDIPILLFLLSQIISTFNSLDVHTSLWGYYSRFNGGLFSIISYIFLYYAFVSNFPLQAKDEQEPHGQPTHPYKGHNVAPIKTASVTLAGMTKRLLGIGLISGTIVALWGLPSHFGYDPTCLLFRGTLDVSCWTDAFRPKERIFSTLGQPNWLAAYFAILLPITLGWLLSLWHNNQKGASFVQSLLHPQKPLLAVSLLLLSILLFVDLLFTGSQSGFIAIGIALVAFFLLLFIKQQQHQEEKHYSLKTPLSLFLIIVGIYGLFTFFIGQPIPQLNTFTLHGLVQQKTTQQESQKNPAEQQALTTGPALENNITASGEIRKIVWQGALDIWKDHKLFGTGVETYAFAYYKYRPAAHNLTSEWDYLYNKAHNEYLNYLATTGAFGLGTHLLFIGWFLILAIRRLLTQQIPTLHLLLSIGMIPGFLSILITNFFGFSVVIVNIFFFLIPAFTLILLDMLDRQKVLAFGRKPEEKTEQELSLFQLSTLCAIGIVAFVQLFVLYRYWQADKAYALGSNLSKVNQFPEAYAKLKEAVEIRGSEPVFQDELSYTSAALGALYLYQKDADTATPYINQAKILSDQVVSEHPNNVVFWKTRTRLFYLLGQVDPQYLSPALEAVRHAYTLAPTDAKVLYNLAVLEGQVGDSEKAVQLLQDVTKLKPDYRDAYFALGVFNRDLAVDEQGVVVHQQYQEEAVKNLRYIQEHFDANDQQVKETLESWGIQ